MIGTAIAEVIKHSIDLVRRREEVNRNTFGDFVAPLMAAFEAIHRDYLSSFRKYRDVLIDANTLERTDALFAEILDDSLFSVNLREQVVQLGRIDVEADGPLRPFVEAISQYLTFATSALDTTPDTLFDEEDTRAARHQYANMPRALLLQSLRSLANLSVPGQDRVWLARMTLRAMTERLQLLHSKVATTYVQLTVNLLKHK